MAQNIDLHRANTLIKHWGTNPPLQRMIAAYLGFGKNEQQQSGSIEEASEFIPAATVSSEEFDALLKKHGLFVEVTGLTT